MGDIGFTLALLGGIFLAGGLLVGVVEEVLIPLGKRLTRLSRRKYEHSPRRGEP